MGNSVCINITCGYPNTCTCGKYMADINGTQVPVNNRNDGEMELVPKRVSSINYNSSFSNNTLAQQLPHQLEQKEARVTFTDPADTDVIYTKNSNQFDQTAKDVISSAFSQAPSRYQYGQSAKGIIKPPLSKNPFRSQYGTTSKGIINPAFSETPIGSKLGQKTEGIINRAFPKSPISSQSGQKAKGIINRAFSKTTDGFQFGEKAGGFIKPTFSQSPFGFQFGKTKKDNTNRNVSDNNNCSSESDDDTSQTDDDPKSMFPMMNGDVTYYLRENSNNHDWESLNLSKLRERYGLEDFPLLSPRPDVSGTSTQGFIRPTVNFCVNENQSDKNSHNLPASSPVVAFPKELATVLAVGGMSRTDQDWICHGRIMHCLSSGGKGGDPGEGTWTTLPAKLPSPIYNHGLAVLGSKIYVIGGDVCKSGEIPGEATANVSIYDAADGTWQNGTPLPEPRAYLGVAVWRQQLFAVGGENKHKVALNSILSYDTEEGVWKKLTNVTGGARVAAAVAVYQNKLYVVGGRTMKADHNGGVLGDVAFYDLIYDSWTLLNPLPVPRSQAALIAMKNSLLLVGGLHYSKDKKMVGLSSILEYDFSTDGWIERANMQQGRHAMGCTAVGSLLYIVGGVASPKHEWLTSVECYDIETGQWLFNQPSYPYPTFGLCLATVIRQQSEFEVY